MKKKIKRIEKRPTIRYVKVRVGRGRYVIVKVRNMAQFNRDIRKLKKKYGKK